MKSFDHENIEKKWQKKWQETDLYKTSSDTDKDKCYVLDMFPYPSGAGLHVGHPKGYIATDVYSRYKKMNGTNVLHPMGWDAFGLPAENYALKNKVHPETAVKENVARFKEQLEKIGFNYDWDREINTTDPEYYKWTQWIFVQLFKKGLAYESHEPINWCPKCKTGLANEDLEGNKCERCDSVVEKKPMRQWVLRITDYADRLLEDLEDLPWHDSVKEMQRNWIGRSEGALVNFNVAIDGEKTEDKIEVFTTRPDTLYGATYTVLAPEHKLVEKLLPSLKNKEDVKKYIKETLEKTEIERTAEGKEKTGVLLEGVKAINPVNGEELPIFIADYVLSAYGTGAIMAVPAHDERDYEFAKKFNIDVRCVIHPYGYVTWQDSKGKSKNIVDFDSISKTEQKQVLSGNVCHTRQGILMNSGEFNGMESDEAKEKITKKAGGKMTVQYRLQDWVFSRQRYWGEPIPIIHCEKCGPVTVPEEDLPVKLPEVGSYEPTGTGESPLAGIDEWVNTKCPKCGGEGKRETNTMPQWAGSSWYYLRYIDPKNERELVDKDKEKYWSPVDVYVGGMEHATRHLIYARFWHKFLYDLGVVSEKEPFQKLYTVGLILAEDGRKMSKRWGNVINPDDVVKDVGADTLRVYEMFMGPFGQAIAWSTDHMVGARRFLEKVYGLFEKVSEGGEKNELLLNQTIKKITEDINDFSFNTAISQLMIHVNDMEKRKSVSRDEYMTFLTLLAPFAVHITEELWEMLGNKKSIHLEKWPEHNEKLIVSSKKTIVVQVNGKKRGEFTASSDATEDELKEKAKEVESVKSYIGNKSITREIVVPGRLVSFVVEG